MRRGWLFLGIFVLVAVASGCTVALPVAVSADTRLGPSTEVITPTDAAHIEEGQRLHVTTRDGADVTGPLVRVEPEDEPASLVLGVAQEELSLSFSDIATMERHKSPPSLWPAFALGAVLDVVVLYVFFSDRTINANIRL